MVVEGLSKDFGDIRAVDELSFHVTTGEVYGFLGQNGAGKSTTIRMIMSLIHPSAGSVKIFGQSLQTHRKQVLSRIGAIIEKPDLYQYLTAWENLRIMARLSGRKFTRASMEAQLERVGIAARANSKVETFSQGMKQRLGIACALIHDPDLIILDEPTNGLDPQGIADIRNLILHLSREEKKTVFVSSHLLSEIEVIADSMLIIDKGKKVIEGKVQDLLHPADTLVEVDSIDNAATRVLLQQSRWSGGLQTGSLPVLKMHRSDIPALNQFLVSNGVEVLSLAQKHSLEAFFLSLTTENQHVAAYTD